MKSYRDQLRAGRYGNYGQGHYLQSLPEPKYVAFSNFSGGLDYREAKEDTPQNSSPAALDVEVTHRDRLRPVPGTTLVEELTHTPNQLVLHASLDYTSELVMFDPPFIGIRTSDETEWLDADLPEGDRKFAYVNFGGTLLFSNGRIGLYAKAAGETEVELVERGPAARTLASFAGRVFAGAPIIGGNREPLGISWSGASSDYGEWEIFNDQGVQTGAGFELLIDDMIQGNYVVAIRTMGLDFMAVLLRNSIWIGRKTNQRARPADFQSRVPGIGAVNDASCVVTRFGVGHLHDSGYYLFDGNSTNLISDQINAELLPLDKSQLDRYAASYNPITKQLFLFTPTCTWVYDLEKQRWSKRSLIAQAASLFASQIPAVTWAEMTGTWAEVVGSWEDYKARETDQPSYLFLNDGELAREDEESGENFGNAMEPYWEFPSIRGFFPSQLLTTKKIFVNYTGSGRLAVSLSNGQDDLVFVRSMPLRTSEEGNTAVSFLEHTGRGIRTRVTFAYGGCEIESLGLEFLPRGPRIETSPTLEVLLEDEGILVEGYYTDFSNYALGTSTALLEWVPSAGSNLSVTAIDAGDSTKYLRFQKVLSGSSGTTYSKWYWNQLSSALNQTVEVVMRLRFDTLGQPKRAPLIRSTSNGLTNDVASYLGAGPPAHVSISRSGSTGALAATPSFAWVGNTWYWMRLRAEGANQFYVKIWQDGEEPAAWNVGPFTLSHGSAGQVGIGLTHTNGTFWTDLARMGIALGGATAPSASPAEGWIVLPGKFSFRISGIEADLRVRIGGIVYTPVNGIVGLNLAAQPVLIEFLNPDDSVFGSYSTPVDSLKSYKFSYHYV